MATIKETLMNLPQENSRWILAYRVIPAWISRDTNPDDFFKPWMYFIADLDTASIVHVALLEDAADVSKLIDLLAEAMVYPAQNSIKPQRPAEIQFEFEEIIEDLESILNQLDIKAALNPFGEIADEIAIELYPIITNGQMPLAGLSEHRGISEALAGEVLKNAMGLWEAAPWKNLENEDILKITVDDQKKPYYISMMGSGGKEFGFAVFRSLKELKNFFAQVATQMHHIPSTGSNVFLFNGPPLVSFEDLYLIDKFDLPTPEGELIPTPLLFKPDDIYRPSPNMVKWYEAVLLAIPQFMKDLKQAEDGKVKASYTVKTLKGEKTVKIEFPAYARKTVEHWKTDGGLKMMAEMIKKASLN